jgi:hypothetical protein
MSKKNKNSQPVRHKTAALKPGAPPSVLPGEEEGGVGRKGRRILLVSLVVIAAGYFFLKNTDPAGNTIYAFLSPVFLLSGYLLVPLALLIKEKN